MANTFIISECGANHNRVWSSLTKLIDASVEAKCDAVKFQTYSSESLYSKYTPDFAGYKDIPKLIKEIEFPKEWLKDAKSYCDDNGIEFISSPFSPAEIDELYDLGVKRIKIASFEATDPRIIKHAAQTKLPLIISLGIGYRYALKRGLKLGNIVQWILNENKHPDLTFLHCNSSYPTPPEDINIGTMLEIEEETRSELGWLNLKIGLSDHTEDILTPAIAVSHGAQVIEKHFTLDRKMEGPDHPFAVEPNQLIEMVKNIRLAEKVMKDRWSNSVDGYLTPSETKKDMSKALRSIIASREIKKGEKLTAENTTTKRPFLENSIPAFEYHKIISKAFLSNRDIQEDEIIRKEDIINV